jgi:hypothetical protein
MRRIVVVLATLGLAAACSSGSPAFALTSASVDPTYFCPGGANNAPYDLHATIQVHNGTDRVVTVDSVSAQMTLASIKGDWLEKVGDHYNASITKFTPSSVAAGASSSLKLTIPSACTSGAYGTGVSSAGDYRVTIRLVTSAGSYSITSANQHEIVAA